MYCGADFSVCDPSESEIYAFNFVNDLTPGDTLASAVWTCTVSQGVDANPSARLSGAASVYESTYTTQRIIGGVAGVSYILMATATTAQGNTLVLWSHSRVEVIN